MRKQLICFIFLFFVCLLMPSMAMADFYLDLTIPDEPFKVSPLESITFMLEVREDGSPASGQSVTFSLSPNDGIASLSTTSATTDSNGRVQTTLSLSGNSSESYYEVTARLDNGQGNVPLYAVPVGTVSDDAKLELYINHLRPYFPGESVAFTFSLRRGGAGVSGKTVTFSVSPNNGTASLSTTSATTDSNGDAGTTVVLGSNASGSYTVTATLDDGLSVSNSTGTVHNPTSQPDVTLDMRIPSGAIPIKPGGSRTFIAIALKDGNSVSGKTVTFSVSPDDGTVSLSTTSATTDSNGEASTTLITGTGSSGSYTVTASAGHSISGTVTVKGSSESNTPPEVELISQEQRTTPEGSTGNTDVPEGTAHTQNTGASTSVAFSEIMYDSSGGLHLLPQWIELHNYDGSDSANLNGWKLQIEGRNAAGKHRNATITLEDFSIPAGATALIVTSNGRQSDEIKENQVYRFFNRHSDAFEQNENRNEVINAHGFYLKLIDRQGKTVDVAGNLDGNRQTKDAPAWELPSVSEERRRIRASIMRRYNVATNTPLDGTAADNWKSTANWELGVSRYWGRSTDIGNPGYRDENKPLPVTLFSFDAELLETGAVVISWTTASELDNAGYNVLRSESREGTFVLINSHLIEGSGTTSERTDYKWVDTTAKPNRDYHYRIEDVSFAGDATVLQTTRLRRNFSPIGKLPTLWGKLKSVSFAPPRQP